MLYEGNLAAFYIVSHINTWPWCRIT